MPRGASDPLRSVQHAQQLKPHWSLRTSRPDPCGGDSTSDRSTAGTPGVRDHRRLRQPEVLSEVAEAVRAKSLRWRGVAGPCGTPAEKVQSVVESSESSSKSESSA